jgi:wyosine [tRNA(Phe)-imidazoG37] synthetase (radical SAM superfamily)
MAVRRQAQSGEVLSTTDHSRRSAGLTYVYPVVSRRAGGLSVGINLNTNNACNWRCIYCQVPELRRGAAPVVDLDLLDRELRAFLEDVLRGDFLERRVAAGMRRLNDIALSGNGEPTSAREFDAVVALVGRVRRDLRVPAGVKTILLTNGSLVQRRSVQAGLAQLAELNGEVWFKLDRATRAGRRAVNDTAASMQQTHRNLEIAARLCATWIQTCVFALDGKPPPPHEIDAYLAFLAALRAGGVPLRGVHLYGIARASMQPEAPRLTPLPEAWLRQLAAHIEALGYAAQVSV